MTDSERKHIYNISQRVEDVVSYLKENDPKYFTDEDFDSLTMILSNIAKVLNEMGAEPVD